MLTALSSINNQCYAWISEKSEGPFFCKECEKEVILKKGLIKQHHFAHKPPKSCTFGDGETDVHYKAKKGIFEGLRSHRNCTFCDLEKRVGTVIPDVFAIIGGNKVAIEIQKSKMTVEKAIERTKAFYKNNLSVIWVIPNINELKIVTDKEENKKITKASKWKIFFHSLAFGRIYIWSGNGSFVNVIHFDDFERYVQETSYYDSSGNEESHGGYYKKLKTIKTINRAPFGEINLAEHFTSSDREPFETKNWTIPRCSIWKDNKGTWWKSRASQNKY